tara:strand:- start:862 stop:1305 length:444 start_codon:yes stop_codon:yes gene_type:complete
MALTGLTTENFSLNSFKRHNDKLLRANQEICKRNDITEFKKIFDMADTFFDPEYPNLKNMKVMKSLIICRYKHSQKLVDIHAGIQKRCKKSTMNAIGSFMDLIKKLFDCYKDGNWCDDILKDISERNKEINGIMEVIDVLDELEYWR